MIEIDFGPTPNVLREEYLDIYEGIHSEIVNTTRFDENSDISTTYLGRSDRSKNDKLKAEESFPISEQGYMLWKLLDGTECNYFWIQVEANHSCQNHSTCIVSHFMLCQNLLLLYNILILINCYIGSITINAVTKTMNNIGIPHGYFITSLGHCINP